MAELTLLQVYQVERGAFDTAGMTSSKIKGTLKKLGISPTIIRDVAIAAYEAELNLVIHSLGGEMTLEIQPETIRLTSKDCGPGIANVDLALKEGYSTAPESVRDMGFGAGMGLPNIKRHCHEFHIQSTFGVGTTIQAIYHLNQ